MIQINNQYLLKYSHFTEDEQNQLVEIQKIISKKAEMLDWSQINTCVSLEEITKMKTIAEKIRSNCDVFLVLGIGGSYLGSKAVIDAFSSYFSVGKPEIIFVGYHLSTSYLQELLTYLKGKSIYLNVISKSGTTLETKITFEYLYQYMKTEYSNYQERIIVTTDADNGELRKIALQENFVTFDIPKNIGGRFSVLTVVGLFPIAVAGIPFEELLKGAKSIESCFEEAGKVALLRYHLEKNNKTVEAITFYEEKLMSLASWYQQLFAETEGKSEKGILPFPNLNTTNLHSLGQYFQEGRKQCFETVIDFGFSQDKNINIVGYSKTLAEINKIVLEQVALAHYQADTPSLIITIDDLTPYNLGQLIYFLELVAAIGGYLRGINPFDQPGVESYKKLVSDQLNNS